MAQFLRQTSVANSRTATDVFEQHLRFRMAGQLEQDLEINYSDDVALLCAFGVLHGRDAVRESARRLALQLPGARFEFSVKHVDGEYAFLVWNASAPDFKVYDGVDTFVIRNGRIVMQSIYYQIQTASDVQK